MKWVFDGMDTRVLFFSKIVKSKRRQIVNTYRFVITMQTQDLADGFEGDEEYIKEKLDLEVRILSRSALVEEVIEADSDVVAERIYDLVVMERYDDESLENFPFSALLEKKVDKNKFVSVCAYYFESDGDSLILKRKTGEKYPVALSVCKV